MSDTSVYEEEDESPPEQFKPPMFRLGSKVPTFFSNCRGDCNGRLKVDPTKGISHGCLRCGSSVHAMCGTGVGDEGYGSPHLCKEWPHCTPFRDSKFEMWAQQYSDEIKEATLAMANSKRRAGGQKATAEDRETKRLKRSQHQSSSSFRPIGSGDEDDDDDDNDDNDDNKDNESSCREEDSLNDNLNLSDRALNNEIVELLNDSFGSYEVQNTEVLVDLRKAFIYVPSFVTDKVDNDSEKKSAADASRRYRSNCITPLIKWATEKYDLHWKGVTNETKRREWLEGFLSLVVSSRQQQKNHAQQQQQQQQTSYFGTPKNSIYVKVFHSIWQSDTPATGNSFKKQAPRKLSTAPPILPQNFAAPLRLDDFPDVKKDERRRMVSVADVVDEMKLRYQKADLKELTDNEKARLICMIKDPALEIAFNEFHGHLEHRSQIDDKSQTAIDVITKHFNDANNTYESDFGCLYGIQDTELLLMRVKDLNPNFTGKLQPAGKIGDFLKLLKNQLTHFVRMWTQSGKNDPTKAPDFTEDDIVLYACFSLYVQNSSNCPLLYWGRDLPQDAQREVGGRESHCSTVGSTVVGSHRPDTPRQVIELNMGGDEDTKTEAHKMHLERKAKAEADKAENEVSKGHFEMMTGFITSAKEDDYDDKSKFNETKKKVQDGMLELMGRIAATSMEGPNRSSERGEGDNAAFRTPASRNRSSSM